MKCPKISNPNEFVELSHTNHGLLDRIDADGNKYKAYLTTFKVDGVEVNSSVDECLVKYDLSARFKHDALLLRKQDVSLAEYAGNLP